jgi:hypothetical protein
MAARRFKALQISNFSDSSGFFLEFARAQPFLAQPIYFLLSITFPGFNPGNRFVDLFIKLRRKNDNYISVGTK